jgi:hypothetical protein
MPEVADVLDEVADPGACEVREFEGPFAVELRPTERPENGRLFDFSETEASDTNGEMREAILAAAYPILRTALERLPEEGTAGELNNAAWDTALLQEHHRELKPSPEWALAVRDWWEEFSGAPADRSAALREMQDVTIPGEPKPETPEQRERFRRAQAKMVEQVANIFPEPSKPKKKVDSSRGPKKRTPKKKR